jgi:hypothetical protein
MNEYQQLRSERSQAESTILWEITTWIQKEVVLLLMSSVEKKYWQESEEWVKIVCYNCGWYMSDSVTQCEYCQSPHRNSLGEAGTWHLFDSKKWEATQPKINLKNHKSIASIGVRLYMELCESASTPISHISNLTREQVLLIISLQPHLYEQGWLLKIKNKTKRKWKPNIEKLKTRFFYGKNS